mgnify:FL=1
MDLHQIAVSLPAFGVKPEHQPDVIEMLSLYARDDDGTWREGEVIETLDRILKVQQQIISTVKIAAPEGIKMREVDHCREVWLSLWRLRKQVIDMIKKVA